MENEKNQKSSKFEGEVITDETTLNSKTDTIDLYAHQISPPPKPKPKLSLRIRKFFIKRQTKRPMEIGLHPKGIHWMGEAIFHSESGCINCKLDLEKMD